MRDPRAITENAAITSFAPVSELQKSPLDRVALRWASADSLRDFLADPELPSEALLHEAVTARQLSDLVDRSAHGFLNLAIRSGDRVLVCLPMSLQLHVSVLSLQRIGAIPVVVDPISRKLSLDECARAVLPRAMISLEKIFVFSAALPSLARLSARISVGPVGRAYSARLEELMKGPPLPDAAIQSLAQSLSPDPARIALATFRANASGVVEVEYHSHQALTLFYRDLELRRSGHENGNGNGSGSGNEIDLAISSGLSLYNIASGISTIIPAFHAESPHEPNTRILLAQLQGCGATCVTLSPSLLRRLLEYCGQKDAGTPSCARHLLPLRRILVSGCPIHETDLAETRRIAPHADVRVLFKTSERNDPAVYFFQRVS